MLCVLSGINLCSVAAGVDCSFVVTAASELLTWGNGQLVTCEQLGYNDPDDHLAPRRVKALRGKSAVASVAMYYTVAIMRDGKGALPARRGPVELRNPTPPSQGCFM